MDRQPLGLNRALAPGVCIVNVGPDGRLQPLAEIVMPGLGRPIVAGESAVAIVSALAARLDPSSPPLSADPHGWPAADGQARRTCTVVLEDGEVLELGWTARDDGSALLSAVDATHWVASLDPAPALATAPDAGHAAKPGPVVGSATSKGGESAASDRRHHARMRFFAAASQDLLQPLNAARVFALALLDQPRLPEPAAALAHRIEQSLRDAEEVIDALVDIVRLDVGAVTAVIETFELEEVVRGLVEQFSSIAVQRGLSLRMGPCAYRVRSDRRLIRRILQNLISNALRYTRTGGVLVGVRRSAGGAIRVDVVDTGIGIAQNDLNRIFEDFRRLDVGSPWGERGLGLGLATCARLGELLGHEIGVRSTPGRGSIFSLALGVQERSRARVIRSDRPKVDATPTRAESLRVLCIEDDEPIGHAMRCLLETWGARVAVASDHDSAIRLARSTPPDVVIADFSIDPRGRHTGLSTIAMIREQCAGTPPRAVLVTAHRSQAIVEAARQAGAVLLYKPVNAGRLRAIVEETGRSKARRDALS